jgi:hypothetical protein
MQTKLFEVRDRATFLPVMATSAGAINQAQAYLLRRVGFLNGDSIILTRLAGESPSSADAYYWNDRTMQVAHNYIQEHFDSLTDGDVIDVEYILGESTKKKQSERGW